MNRGLKTVDLHLNSWTIPPTIIFSKLPLFEKLYWIMTRHFWQVKSMWLRTTNKDPHDGNPLTNTRSSVIDTGAWEDNNTSPQTDSSVGAYSVRGHQLLANSLVGCTVVICHPQQYIVLTPVIGWWRFMWLWFNNPCQGLGWLNSQLLLTIHQNKSPFVLVFQCRNKISKCGLPTSMFHIPAY